MKNILTILAILSFLFSNAQFNEGTIYLKNSTEIKGLIKLKTLGGVKFKESESSDIRQYEDRHLTGYDIKENGTIRKYRFKVAQGYPRRMKIVKLGKINLYSVFKSNSGSAMGMGMGMGMEMGMGMGMGMGMHGSGVNIYFIEKDNVTIRIGSKLKNGKLYLIEDCPQLIDKIKSKELNKREITKIIDYYNKDCL